MNLEKTLIELARSLLRRLRVESVIYVRAAAVAAAGCVQARTLSALGQ